MRKLNRIMFECGLSVENIREIMMKFCKVYKMTIGKIDSINVILSRDE